MFHLHSDLSNGTTIIDSCTNYKAYIDKAKELGMSAIAFSEHGNVFEWLHKKEYAEKNGLKYIHGVEAYITKTLDEKVRDNFHCGLYARNYDGVLEINKLVSNSFNRQDGHYHYSPRITFDELTNTSDNVIITTACLGGVLYKGDDDIKRKFIDFLSLNNHRAFLEVQHHNANEQIEYNKELLRLSHKYNIKIIAGTDTHSLDKEHSVGRDILQARKNIRFDNEGGWDTVFKTYEELINSYEVQNSIPEKDYMLAIENTNLLADMVDEFEVSRDFKYPKISDDSKEKVFNIVEAGIEKKGLKKLSEDEFKRYKDAIEYELSVYEKQGMFDFLLLDTMVKDDMRDSGIYCGYSRGSVAGSVVAWLMGITDVDSVKYELIFERFVNEARQSLGDVDTDWAPSERDVVRGYIHKTLKRKIENLYTADIITFNTIATKGSVKDIMGGLRSMVEDGSELPPEIAEKDVLSLEETEAVCKDVEDKFEHYKSKYPSSFKYVELVSGTIMSIGSHPCGIVVSPLDLDSNVGTFTLATNEYPVTALNMKELDSLNYVKLDVLGLDNIEIINKGCSMAGIERLTPDNMDFSDENVWENIVKSPVGIFQFEGDFAHSMLKKALSDDSLSKSDVKKSKIDIMSAVNGAIRPSGESFREQLTNGESRDNGHEALNELLSDTNGFLIYQEQIISFLNRFCGYSMSEADLVRRGLAKKIGTEQFIPAIKSGFIKTMKSDYGVEKEKSEKLVESFLQVINDASSYGFSLNHSMPYSAIGFACGYLRTYYPLEFLSVALDINEKNLEKSSKFLDYMSQHTDIELSPAKFRFSKGKYFPDKKNKTIYKGVGSIKGLNETVGDELYDLRDDEYESFYDLLDSISMFTSLKTNQLTILIRLGYFSEFGSTRVLEEQVNIYNSLSTAKVVKRDKFPEWNHIIEKYSTQTEKQFRNLETSKIMKEITALIDVKPYTLSELITFSNEYLGYVDVRLDVDKRYCTILSIDSKYTPKVEIQSLGTGKRYMTKISKKIFDKTLKVGDIIYVKTMKEKAGWRVDGNKANGKPNFVKDPDKRENHIEQYHKLSELELEELNG